MSNHIDVASIKQAARNRWPEILSRLGGIPQDILDGKHHPCPKCGGVDRFRFTNRNGDGSLLCNQCFNKGNGDGISALEWLTGQGFGDTIKRLAEYLGIQPSQNGHANGQPKAKKKGGGAVYATLEAAIKVGILPGLTHDYPGEPKPHVVRTDRYDTFVVLRFDLPTPPGKKQDKTFRPVHSIKLSDGRAGWKLGYPPGKRPVFRRKELEVVTDISLAVVCGGEKATEAAVKLGLLATTNAGGEKAVKQTDWSPLTRFNQVVVSIDNDAAGESHGHLVAMELYRIKPDLSVKVLRLPGLPPKGDIVEWIAAGGTRGQFLALVESTAPATPEEIATWQNERTQSSLGCATGGGIAPLETAASRTEIANGKRLIAKHGDTLRWCNPWGKWLTWDGSRWAVDQQRIVESLAKAVIQGLWTDLAGLVRSRSDDDGGVKAILSFLKAGASAHGIDSMIRLARSEAGVPILPDALDCDPWLLNCQNGTLDLRTGELRPHGRQDYLTKLCPVTYDPTAECRVWLSFLDRIVPEANLRSFLRRAVGMSLTGNVKEHVLFFLYGTGSNGKSTFLNQVHKVLGDDYAMKAPPELLMVKKGESHPTERADLAGKRFVACVEAGEGRRLAEALVKELTGGDPIRARRMREDFWQFDPTHKIWLAANHKPVIRGTDWGIWRRIKLIPFIVKIPDEEQDKDLSDKLLTEAAGILHWAVLGCIEWQKDGLGEPEAVRKATAEYRSEMDILGAFMAECCAEGDGIVSAAKDLYAAYQKWAQDSGEDSVTQTAFGMVLSERGYARDRFTSGPYKGKTRWNGIGLRAAPQKEEDDGPWE
jgi:putative DNA primase/helicase